MAIQFDKARKSLAVSAKELISLMDSLGGHATMSAELREVTHVKLLDSLPCPIKQPAKYYRIPITNAQLSELWFGMAGWVKEFRVIDGVDTDITFYQAQKSTLEIDDDLVDEIREKLRGSNPPNPENPPAETDRPTGGPLSEQQEKAQFYNQSSANATTKDYEHYAKMPTWTQDETVALLLGKNPKIVSWESIAPPKGVSQVSQFVGQYRDLLELLQRATLGGKPSDTVIPMPFLEWAKQMEIYIQPELSALVERFGSTNVDWRDRYEKLKKDANTLQDLFDKQGEQFDRLVEASALLNKHSNQIANTAKILTEERDALKARVAELEANQPTGGQEPDEPVSVKEETTYLNIIGGLLKLLLKEKMPGGLNKWTQDTITSALLDSHSDKRGISPSSLGHKFAAANRSLKSS